MNCTITTKNNVFIVGLQRVGSNYIEKLLNNNIEGYSFRSHLVCEEVIKNVSHITSWYRHTLPRNNFRLPVPHKEILLITKNPYIWVESLVKRNEIVDIMGMDEKSPYIWNNFIEDYFIYEEHPTDKNKLTDKLSIQGLCELYKDFNEVWLSNKYSDIPVKQIKYEDFIDNKKCKLKFNELNYRLKGNLKFPSKPVKWSENFTIDDLEYFKNEKILHLSSKEINTINEVIGKELITKLGYEYRDKD